LQAPIQKLRDSFAFATSTLDWNAQPRT